MTGIVGTTGDDTLTGTTGNDVIKGLGGDDSLSGLGGNDTLEGGIGNDALDGGDGVDTASYAHATGSVTVNLSTGTASGADGTDTLTSIENVTGSAYDDTLIGNGNGSHLNGGAGNDFFEPGYALFGSSYYLDGGDGIDTVSFANASSAADLRLDGSIGSTIGQITVNIEDVIGSSLDDFIKGSAADNIIHGGLGNDIFSTGTGGGTDQFYGEEGNDTLVFSTDTSLPGGNILFDGGAGNDTLWLDTAPVGVTVDLGLEGVAQSLGTLGTLTVAGVENIYATDFNDVVTGNDSDNYIDSGKGDDTLSGAGGDDYFMVDLGSKVIDGGAGNDTLAINLDVWPRERDMTISLDTTGVQAVTDGLTLTLSNIENIVSSEGNDRLTGNSDDNHLDGGFGDDTLWGMGGNDTLTGGPGGSDTASYSFAPSSVQVDLAAGTATGGDGSDTLYEIENVTGSAYDDALSGDRYANIIDGGAGADVMRGLGGSDTYIVDNAGDQVIETSTGGTDTVKASISYTLSDYVENLTLSGTGAINGTGNAAANVITGNAGINILAGLDGNDTYIVQNGGDKIVETATGGIDTVQSGISYTLGANVENLTLTGSAVVGTGNELRNVIVGNAGANIIDGGAGADLMEGGFGNDTYIVDDTGDHIIDGDGFTFAGTDLVKSSISWRLGSDLENLTLTGTSAINGTGNELNNVITGNSAANILDGGYGNDTLRGGDGNDTYVVDNPNDKVIESQGGGTDMVKSTGDYVLGLNLENLTLLGTAVINGTGNTLANIIVGNAAANVIDGGRGADTLKGGAGDDTYYVDNSGDRVIETSTGGHDLVVSSIGYTIANYVEDLTLGGTRSINGTGNSLDNTITGNAGNNVLDGRGGADVMIGGDGNDTYVFDNAGDIALESYFASGGNDTILSSVTLESWMTSGIENLTLTGTAAINATGDEFANVLTGNSAANVLDGGAGDDIMKGGNGNDTYIVSDSGDTVIETSSGGVDTVQSFISYVLPNCVENLVLESWATNGTGNNLANTITGNANDNVLDGGTGADTLIGGGGSDTYVVDNPGDKIVDRDAYGNSTVISSISYSLGSNLENLVLSGTNSINGTGNALDNVIFGNDAANTLSGAGGSDYLDGAGGNDKLSGGDGDDILVGGAGHDTLQGGAGSDVFGFDVAPASTNLGTITDFSASDDTIALSQSAFGGLALGDLSASAFQAGTSAVSAATRIIYDKSSGSIYYDADGTGSAGKVLFAKVTAGTNLTVSNFYVVDLSTTTQTASAAKVAAGQTTPSSDTAWIAHWEHANDFGAHLHALLPAVDSGLF